MNNLLKHKGYCGSVEVSLEDGTLHGKLECINDLVTYEAQTVSELQSAFEVAVDDYLETCQEIGKEPDRPMSGTFNIRIGQELHKKAYLAARNAGISLNDYVKKAIEDTLVDRKEYHFHIDRRSEITESSFGFMRKRDEKSIWKGTFEKGRSH
ncbi:HicB family protein (plasmid) [Rahnella aceris]|uniref:HicB family protein n=1 Tax=Rahnella sp. (strain Y9602) TaxID=2703885 RepID=A0A0H3FIG1_RAHSY|nr:MULTISPECIES: type II toxin-antitoxin system HicB family antitoxin [Rahnella]ADW76126.1 HicB family protein [Rahnella aceris]